MEAKKKIFWFVQQLAVLGGTEMVTLNLIDSLKESYDVTLVVSGEYNPETAVFSLPEGVKILSLKMPERFIRLQDHIEKDLSHFNLFAALGNALYGAWGFLFKRRKYRKEVLRLTANDSILIASALDSYLSMPKGRTFYFHYHFNDKTLFSLGERLLRPFLNKPDKWIFITEETYLKALVHKPFKGRSHFIYNPVRFERELNTGFHDGRLLFIGRYEKQKNPLFLVSIGQELKKDGCPFKMDLYGEGPLKDDIKKAIVKGGLEDEIQVHGKTKDPKALYLSSDLLLLVSAFEGFPLVIGEANSQSLPVISSNWGSGTQEACKDGENGYVINSNNPHDYAQAIEGLLQDKEKLARLKESSYVFASRLCEQEISSEWKKVLS